MDRRSFLKRAAVVPLVAAIPAPAYAEGSYIPPFTAPASIPVYPIEGQNTIQLGYKSAIMGYEYLYPTLAVALKGSYQATSTTVEWTRDSPDPRYRKRVTAHKNYMQILRHPYSVSGTAMAVRRYGGENVLRTHRMEQLHQHLASVERVLTNGVPSKTGFLGTCGGIKCFPKGTPRLAILRDLSLLQNRQGYEYDGYAEEWIGEFSLIVT